MFGCMWTQNFFIQNDLCNNMLKFGTPYLQDSLYNICPEAFAATVQ
jgi:hypothetical protein